MKRAAQALFVWASCLSAALLVPPPLAQAQDKYPVRPVRILIPFPAGGASDTIGRTIGEQLSVALGQPVVVDNRPGAAGRLATQMLTHAEPDGYTLLVGGVGPLAISPAVYARLPYDAARDFMPITRVAEIINVMVVNPKSGAATVKQFIDWARTRPGRVRFGSSGPGQFDHLVGVFFAREAGLNMIHVPYKGGGPALVDMVSGDIELMFATYVTAVPHLKSGRLRALAVGTAKRREILPDLPAVSETLPGFGASNWNGMFVPAGTPRALVGRLYTEINKALHHPDVKKRQNRLGIEPVGSPSSEAFGRFIREDTARWKNIVKAAGVHIEQ